MSVRMDQPIRPRWFYGFGLLCLIFAVVKLTIEVHWSWWRVLLPLWVFLGHNALYVLVGFICLFFVRYGKEEDVSAIVETNFLTGYQLAAMLCFLIFVDNLLRWMERREDSYWFGLFSGKLDTAFVFGLFSLVAQLLYWSKIVTELNNQQPDR
jgi:glucan phosphoethanolaminetransferase (alkaline phosphatase superfamily)